MDYTVTVSEKAYSTLERKARANGKSVEDFLEQWLVAETEAEDQHRRQAVDTILDLQRELKAKYGLQSDSTLLIREDRDR